MSCPERRPRGRQAGFSLIELMVALVIGSIMTLAIFGVMFTFEARKRTTTTTNDAIQAGSYAMYVVDKYIRSAGSGFTQAGPRPNESREDRLATAFGCRILAAKGGSTLLPRGSALDAPFENVNTTGTAGLFRLAPVIIAPQQSSGLGFGGERSDVLIVMAGTGGFGEVPIPLTGAISANTMPVNSAVSLEAGDMLLLADQLSAVDDVDSCMVQQVSTGAVTLPVGLGGSPYGATTISGFSHASYDDKSVALKIGHPTRNPPNFLVVGVGANNTLLSYDLLQTRTPALQAIADNVFELHAVYGIDADGDGVTDAWYDPRSAATAPNDLRLSTLMAGTGAAADKIGQIKAIRVAMIVRSSLQEKDADVSPATFTLFGDVGLGRVRNLSTDERRFRYRVIEMTIPVRNAMLAPRQ